ncbi:hypothetical protein MCEMSEM23_01290 [Rhabdaerophilaceae bacterium]
MIKSICLGNCRSILLSYGTVATGSPIADLRRACTSFAQWIATFLFGCLVFATGASAQSPALCDAGGALDAEISAISDDGIITLRDGLLLSLANIVWPDRVEPRLRAGLASGLLETLNGQKVQWKPVAGPDRWGATPAFLFVQEPAHGFQMPLPPFWLQAGLVEAGLVPAWPDVLAGHCWTLLLEHEATAIERRRGHWAPRVQARRIASIVADPASHAGRRLAIHWRVASVRPWRDLLFLNASSEGRKGLAVSLTEHTRAALTARGVIPGQLAGVRILSRITLPSEGLRRARIESPDHLTVSSSGQHRERSSQR